MRLLDDDCADSSRGRQRPVGEVNSSHLLYEPFDVIAEADAEDEEKLEEIRLGALLLQFNLESLMSPVL